MERRSGELKNGLNSSVRFEPANYSRGAGPMVSTASVSIEGAERSCWRLRIYAELDGEMVCVGAVRTLPGSRGSRLVAVAHVPGARAWDVRGERATPPAYAVDFTTDAAINVRIMASDVGGLPGVSAISGQSEPAEMPVVTSGVDGTVDISGRITGWSAYAGASGGTVTVLGQTVIVPPYGIISAGEIIAEPWPTRFVFANTVAYLITSVSSQVSGGV